MLLNADYLYQIGWRDNLWQLSNASTNEIN